MAMTHLTTPTRWLRPTTSRPASGLKSTGFGASADPIDRMRDDMNRLFENFFGGAGWSMDTPAIGSSPAVMQPELDIFESEKAYHLSVELPGVNRDDIDLSVDDDALIVRARKESVDKDVDDDQYHRVERRFGRFERMLALPADADGENVSAEFKNGVLEVTIPRLEDVESTRGRRIEIKDG
jgi:HSP20 family protein